MVCNGSLPDQNQDINQHHTGQKQGKTIIAHNITENSSKQRLIGSASHSRTQLRCSRGDKAKMNQSRARSAVSLGRAPGKLLLRLCSESSWEVPSPQVEDAPNPWHSRPKTCAFTCMKICFQNVNTYGAPGNDIRVEVFLGKAYCCLGLLWKCTWSQVGRQVAGWLDGD